MKMRIIKKGDALGRNEKNQRIYHTKLVVIFTINITHYLHCLYLLLLVLSNKYGKSGIITIKLTPYTSKSVY